MKYAMNTEWRRDGRVCLHEGPPIVDRTTVESMLQQYVDKLVEDGGTTVVDNFDYLVGFQDGTMVACYMVWVL